jgi:hypothetical protein
MANQAAGNLPRRSHVTDHPDRTHGCLAQRGDESSSIWPDRRLRQSTLLILRSIRTAGLAASVCGRGLWLVQSFGASRNEGEPALWPDVRRAQPLPLSFLIAF